MPCISAKIMDNLIGMISVMRGFREWIISAFHALCKKVDNVIAIGTLHDRCKDNVIGMNSALNGVCKGGRHCN